jgi:hypothetical protein
MKNLLFLTAMRDVIDSRSWKWCVWIKGRSLPVSTGVASYKWNRRRKPRYVAKSFVCKSDCLSHHRMQNRSD